MPKVSVVLPSYNGENYISSSIESVCNQSLKDFELIIVDDCSKDNTLNIAYEYAQKDERIRVIHNSENLKLPEALNVGFSRAEGKYLTWTSDDNIFLKHALEEMSYFLDSNNEYDMVCTKMIFSDQNLSFIQESEDYVKEKMLLRNVVGASFMYRKDVLDNLGGYRSDLFCAEDYDYWIRLLIAGMKIGYLPGCYYIYRNHSDSLTSTKKMEIREKTETIFIKYFDWFLKLSHGNNDSLLNLYNIVLKYNDKYKEYKESIVKELSLLAGEIDIAVDKKCIVYGAGEIGRLIVNSTQINVCYFADKDEKKVGSKIGDILVLSIDEMIKMANDNYHIVIAVSYEKQYEVISSLLNKGMRQYSLYMRCFKYRD